MNMNLGNIKNELAKRGITAEEITVFKNGISCVGLQIVTDTNVRPIIYYAQDETLHSFMRKLDAALNRMPDFNLDLLNQKEFVLSNLYVTLQRRNDPTDVLCRSYLNLDAVMRLYFSAIDHEECGSIKVSASLLDAVGVTVEEAWENAFANMLSKIRIRSMSEVLGLPEELLPALFDVVTTENGMDGASGLLFPDIFKSYCQDRDVNSCIIIPSSTEELLVVSDEGIDYYDDYAMMVHEVNSEEVDPMIQLDPVIYRYDIESGMIKIVAEV